MELTSDNFISKHCGQISQPWTIITQTNTLTVTFSSDDGGTRTGFLALWTATTAPPTYPTPTGCDSCDFPFGDTTLNTCISVLDVDTQPWCSPGPLSPPSDEGTHIFPPPPKISCSDSDSSSPPYYTPPTDEGTHIFPPPKITCSNRDSSCPSSPPQTVITSPDYPLNYPNYANQVN